LRQHGGKTQFDTVAVGIGAVQFAHLFVVPEERPAGVVAPQFLRFKGKREANGAGIIVGVHRRNDQVVAARSGATLHVGDKSRNGFRFKEHQHHGGENKVIFTVEA
jgi:hypothetical protein